jgi:hypothetical protein
MSKQLLVDYIPFDITPQILSEAKKHTGGAFSLSGPLQKAGEKNHNGRVYPRPVLEREVEKYKQIIGERRALGELDHPDSSIINLKNVSHNVKECHWEGDTVMGTIELLTTPSGNIAMELIKNNIRVGISSRGLGSVRNMNENTVEVQDDFELLCFDLVSSPSTRGAFMNLAEGVSRGKPVLGGLTVDKRDMNKFMKIEGIIRDILSEIR